MAQTADGPVALDLLTAPQLEIGTQWSHITELEMRSGLTGYCCRARSSSLLRTRFVLFIDNQSCLAVLVKSPSSRKLNGVARKTAAILLCTLSRPLYAYTDTDGNPADAVSRRRHATSKSSNCTKGFTPLIVSCSTRSRNIACSLVAKKVLYNDAVAAFSTWLHQSVIIDDPMLISIINRLLCRHPTRKTLISTRKNPSVCDTQKKTFCVQLVRRARVPPGWVGVGWRVVWERSGEERSGWGRSG